MARYMKLTFVNLAKTKAIFRNHLMNWHLCFEQLFTQTNDSLESCGKIGKNEEVSKFPALQITETQYNLNNDTEKKGGYRNVADTVEHL